MKRSPASFARLEALLAAQPRHTELSKNVCPRLRGRRVPGLSVADPPNPGPRQTVSFGAIERVEQRIRCFRHGDASGCVSRARAGVRFTYFRVDGSFDVVTAPGLLFSPLSPMLIVPPS